MDKERIKKVQNEFYKRGDAGCRFAEYVAQYPGKYKWEQQVFETVDVSKIDAYVQGSVANPDVQMVSIILPTVVDEKTLKEMIDTLTTKSSVFFQEPEEEYQGFRLIRLRAHILGKTAWVSGFGPMNFLPKTRQAPHTELIVRVAERPNYKKSIMTPTPHDQLHVADLEIPEMGKNEFTKTFQESFKNTTHILGHGADELSAAKTTFILPKGGAGSFGL